MMIDPMSRKPVYEQIVDQLEQMVLSGAIRPGDQLPSVRSLSLELSLNPNTIQKAYTDLDTRGILYAVPGRGCFVSENAPAILSEERRRELGTLERLARSLAEAGISEEELLERVRRGCRAISSSGNMAPGAAGSPGEETGTGAALSRTAGSQTIFSGNGAAPYRGGTIPAAADPGAVFSGIETAPGKAFGDAAGGSPSARTGAGDGRSSPFPPDSPPCSPPISPRDPGDPAAEPLDPHGRAFRISKEESV